ncbi:hypothetical protein [Tahibacter amnicola]|uniref:Uncharacterized protein n=1 Tax=Tahibacter amnicola TaxID=2976241 RepID=A0ABY6BGP1_9GAMM|nr:hypothetical protein [Tahibacter amnicola]UXI68942.1 hypothetical protein N4264_04605 [Tahibacter amnicola]
MTTTEGEAEIVGAIVTAGWLQGSTISATDLVTIGLPSEACENRIGIVVSQSCDIRCGKLATEPKIELLLAEVVERLDGQFINCRHPRQLHVDANDGDQVVHLSIRIVDRHFVDRAALAKVAPMPLSFFDQDLELVVRWIIGRYLRSAFPGEFNKRLKPAEKRLQTAMSAAPSVVEMLISIVPEGDIGAEEHYDVDVVLLLEGIENDIPQSSWDEANELKRAVTNLLRETNIVSPELDDFVQIATTFNMAVGEYREYQRFEQGTHLSLAADTAAPPPTR